MNLPTSAACQLVPQAAMVIWRGGAELGVGDLHGLEEDVAGVERDAAEGGVADGARLLVDLLEHEVLVAGLLGLDGIPEDALDLQGQGLALEVGEGDAFAGEDGELAVGEEVDVAGVMQDAGNVGGEEELAVADAQTAGGPMRAATSLLGSWRRGRRWRRLR